MSAMSNLIRLKRNTLSKLVSRSHFRYNHNLTQFTNLKKPTSTAVQFAKLFTIFAGGLAIYDEAGLLFDTKLPSYKKSPLIQNIGDIIAFGTFSLLSAQKVLANNVIHDALVARPTDIKRIYMLAGGRIGARTGFYFILATKCLESFASLRELLPNNPFPIIAVAFLHSIPAFLSVWIPWLYGRTFGYYVLANNHANIIQSYIKSGMESHLIGPRYSFYAMRSHWIDLMFLKNPIMSRMGCTLLAVGALSPHLYYAMGKIDVSEYKHGDSFEWRYEWRSNDHRGSQMKKKRDDKDNVDIDEGKDEGGDGSYDV